MRVQIPAKLVPVFAGRARYRAAYGGRGSGKSFTFAKMLAIRGLERPLRILCAREYQNSLRESSQAEIVRAIESEDWLNASYTYGEGYIRGRNGTEFLFRGLRHNYQAIKSMAGINICWVEEAETVSDASWRTLIPTIREPGSEIWATWNPEREDSPTRERFILNPPPDARIAECNWRDNPWFPAELEAERLYDYTHRRDIYAHVWEGDCITRTDALVLRGREEIAAFEPQPNWDGPYYGADWGFAVDPTALVRLWVHGRTLYVEHEAYGHGVEIDHLPALFDAIPGARQHVCRADSARPETISYMQRNGYPRMIGVEKWPGSVEDGVEHLRSYERIVIHPRCTHTAREARLWSYRIDRQTGDVRPDLAPGNDHCWDAIRYALGPLIRMRQPARTAFIAHMGR